MRVIKANNINDAFVKGVDLFKGQTNFRRQKSRNGDTLECVDPVTTVYKKPWERVLLEETRDANPFFHLVEAIWMMAGSNNLRQLTHFNAGMANFSDNGELLNGAYGYRWRKQFDHDQLPTIIEMLKQDPDSRRVVLQMWDAVHDLNSPSLDLPMGKYYQISDSFHIYDTEQWKTIKNIDFDVFSQAVPMHYPKDLIPVVDEYTTFTQDCKYFLNVLPTGKETQLELSHCESISWSSFKNRIFPLVLRPMIKAFTYHKMRDYENCYKQIENIQAEDWRMACTTWITKRKRNWEQKLGVKRNG